MAQAISAIIQALTSASALVVGGIWVYRNFNLKRQAIPRAQFEFDVTARDLAATKLLLSVVVTITNNGNVLLRLRNGELKVYKVSPLPGWIFHGVERGKDFRQMMNEGQSKEVLESWSQEILFPHIDTRPTSETEFCEIEPGNSERLRFDFVLDREIEVFRLRSQFENLHKPKRRMNKKSWSRIYWHWTAEYEVTSLLCKVPFTVDKND